MTVAPAGDRRLQFRGAMRRIFSALTLLAVGVTGAPADDVVFAAAPLKLVNGKYFPTEASHLYRIASDGTRLRQLTSNTDSDTDPCLSPDGKRLLLWRRHRDDSVGDIRLISAALDGSDQALLYRFVDLDLGRPSDLARALFFRNRIRPFDLTGNGNGFDVELKMPSKSKAVPAKVDWVSKSGRFGQFDTQDRVVALNLRTGRELSVTGDTPLGDDAVVSHSVRDLNGIMGVEFLDGTVARDIEITNIFREKKVECFVFGNSERQQDSSGSKAFWFGPGRRDILLQEIWRSEAGGNPAIYCFNATTGRVRFEMSDEFVEDVDSSRTHFLTTTWKWGRGWMADGTVPLRKLVIWDARTVKPRPLGFESASCIGACFVPAEGKAR